LKLNQVIAVLPTVKINSTKAKTSVYHLIQKSTMFQAISRTFQPVAEDYMGRGAQLCAPTVCSLTKSDSYSRQATGKSLSSLLALCVLT